MPQRMVIKRKLTSRSDRVKSVELHPTEPWMMISLYSGSVAVWNHEKRMIVKTFEVCGLPVRVARFVTRKNWIVAGADDNQIRVFNYNTFARVHMFEAHTDYIRTIAVHPTQPYILSGSDDMLIKLWDWDRKWACCQVFEGHNHYIMQVIFNPKDSNQFASASLDRTVKVWQLGSSAPNFTLEGHGKGVNCVDYYSGGDKPYLISGADDCLVKIWDYQNKTCVQTLEGHTQNVTCVSFHPELPFILTGAEDGTVRVWHSNTYRLENTLIYGMERVWCVCGQPGSNNVALGYDEGSILIKLGRDEPAMSMDSSGKIMWARHSEIQLANLKTMGDFEIRDGERLPLGVKDMGSCEIYPQTLQHSPNGRFVMVCGDGEYIIYTAMALRNKSFGSAQEFVWAYDSSQYAIKDGNSTIKIYKNFKEKKAFKPNLGVEGIFGGFLLGVRSSNSLVFYDWESGELVRRIEIQPKHIFWSDSGELVCIAADESFFVLRYLSERVSTALESKEDMTDDGLEDAFKVLGEVPDRVKTGVWVGDCFIYTNSVKRLNYYVGGEIITIAHLDRVMYLLGYIPSDNRLYLGDKNLNIISYYLLLSVLEYQTAVMRRDFSHASKVLPSIPKEQRTRVANFLEKQGFRRQALAVTTDPEHKFELALQLGELEIALELAEESQSEHKWRQLAEQATTKCQFRLAQKCLHKAQDNGGLLLLATVSGNTDMVGRLAEQAERDGGTNVAFLTYFMQGRLDKCLELLIKTDRLPEAGFLARTYLPSQVSRVVNLWRESLSKVNKKAADALADPTQYGNLFPDFQQALLAEQYLKETCVGVRPAAEYPLIMPNEDRNVLEECADFVSKERVSELKTEYLCVNDRWHDEGVEVEKAEEFKSMGSTDSAVGGGECQGRCGTEGEQWAHYTKDNQQKHLEKNTLESRNESFITAADGPAPPEPGSVEKVTDPVSPTEEKSVPTATSLLPVTALPQLIEPYQAESAPAPEEEDSSTEIVEEDILEESVIHFTPTESQVVQSRPQYDIRSSVEKDIQGMSPAADAVPAVRVSEAGTAKTSDTIIPTSETRATTTVEAKDCVVTVEFTEDTDALASESESATEMSVYDAMEKGLVSLDAPAINDTEEKELPVTEELVSEKAASAVLMEELVSSEKTDAVLEEPDQEKPSPQFVPDPLLEPLQDKKPLLEPEPAREEATDEGQSGDNPLFLQPEPEVVSPAKAPAEGDTAPGDHEDPAEDHEDPAEDHEDPAEDHEDPAEDHEVDVIQQVLDELDLDNLDLDDIDTTNVNLDEDLSE